MSRRIIPEAELVALVVADLLSTADHVRSQRYRVKHSGVDLLGDPMQYLLADFLTCRGARLSELSNIIALTILTLYACVIAIVFVRPLVVAPTYHD